MNLTYRTSNALLWGAGKGSPLSTTEGDENIWSLYTMILALQEHLSSGVSIYDITQPAPNQMLITLTNDVEFTLTIPSAGWTPADPVTWQAGKVYYAYNTFAFAGALYLVNVSHTSGATFSADATDGSGHLLYTEILPPVDQPAVQVMDMSTWTPTTADVNTYNRMTNPSGTTVVIEPNSTFAAPVGSELSFRQASTGAITFEAVSPAVVNVQDGCQLITSGQGATVTLKKVDVDEWDAMGRLLLVA